MHFQDKKVFTVSGPYPSLRAALRRRGWVEKINNASAITEATRLSANGINCHHVSYDDVCMSICVAASCTVLSLTLQPQVISVLI